MRVGLHAIGIGAGARREVIEAVAVSAEACGFATLWAGEHVVMVDHSQSRYPYSPDGQIAVPATADWVDPFVVVATPPDEPREVEEWVAELALRWSVSPGALTTGAVEREPHVEHRVSRL